MIFNVKENFHACLVGIFIVKCGIGQQGSKNKESALDILKKRYARGEISKEEFDEKKRDIM